ncbi:MAG TPA: S8 family serine peptidase, partial [Blastocatellia bacterium]|nr:S8 family serine peptidase [Blastocatellia bacterium]
MTKPVSEGRVCVLGLTILLACICSAGSSTRARTDTGPDAILFARYPMDPVMSLPASELSLERFESGRHVTRLVQFTGPVRSRWIDALRATGARVVGYIPNNAYVVRADADELASIETLRSAGLQPDGGIRWVGRWPGNLKIDPMITDETLTRGPGANRVEVELLDSTDAEMAESYIFKVATEINAAPRRFQNYRVLDVTLPSKALADVAAFGEVLAVTAVQPASLNDERSAQIVAGNLTVAQTQPSGPGYLDWMSSLHLNAQPDFLIDISDSGIDKGTVSSVHPDFLDDDQNSRLVYVSNYTDRSPSEDTRGHGTLVASIACGYKMSGKQDELGYFMGVGISPWNRFGSSKIFEDNGVLGFRVSFTQVASAAYKAGARISNNSWGRSGNSYDAASQEFDSLVRDAQPTVPGNQEMAFVFSAGNLGPGGTISSPGTAKNVITTGGSESYRPAGSDHCDMDGKGGIGPDEADNAQELLRFSSGGPTADGRIKPDLVAPATHIQGAASRSERFFGEGLCAGLWPPNQTLYTWSSGTSLAAPHVTGAAALLRQFFTTRKLLGDGKAPSPAMIKAFLANSASYMTGENAG